MRAAWSMPRRLRKGLRGSSCELGAVGWAKARSAVPTISSSVLVVVGTLRFAHPTILRITATLLRQILRTLRGCGDRAGQQRLQAVRSHQHVERGGRGAAGRGNILAQRGGREFRAMQQFAGSCDGFAGEPSGKLCRQAGCDTGAREFFGEQEDV